MSETRKTVLDNRYDVGRTLGSGGMGEVYLARDRVLGRDVALKVLRTQYAGDSEFAERFKREARSAASLSHPNIVQVYDRGETEDGSSYIAMEYVPGGTLKEKIVGEGPLGAREAGALGAQVAAALGAAHERGMVHRDIKPQNVLLTARGDAKVADFGIARAGSSVTISRTGSVLGTAGYMSPEQALGKSATPKSDLYSLGVVLYEALTGELPYTADNPIAVSMKHVNQPVRSPREIDPTIPEGMDALVTRLMAKDPDDRYASADELADDLWRVSRGREPTAALAAAPAAAAPTRPQQAPVAAPDPTRRITAPRQSPVRRRRRRVPWFLLLVAAILFFLGTMAALRSVMGPDFANGWFDFLGQEKTPQAGPSAPQTVKVPEVVGLTTAEARQRITGAGLDVGQINSFPSSSVEAGKVIASGYSAGEQVPRGTDVNLDVSTGPQPAPSPSPTATAQPSPEPASTASPSAAAQPSPQQNRQPARQPSRAGNRSGSGPQNDPSTSPDATAAPDDGGAERGAGNPEDNSGPGNGGLGNGGLGNGGLGNGDSGNSGPGNSGNGNSGNGRGNR